MCSKLSDSIATFNVSGKIFKISTEKLAHQPESMLTKIVNTTVQPDQGFFIDCCPKIFEYILRFVVHGIQINPKIIAEKFGSNEDQIKTTINTFGFKGIYDEIEPTIVESDKIKPQYKGSYGEIFFKDGKAIKKFAKLSHLIQEYTALKYLEDCKHIVKIVDVNFEKLELSMEAYDCSLREWLTEKPSDSDLRIIARDVLMGLNELHERSLVHGDVKPGNIFIRRSPLGAVLGDCGFTSLAKYAKVERAAAIYRDPFIEGDSDFQKCDMYSLGICLLEMFGDLRLNRQSQSYEELKEIINNKIIDPIMKKIITDLVHEDKSRRPTTKTVIYHLFNEVPPKLVKSFSYPLTDTTNYSEIRTFM